MKINYNVEYYNYNERCRNLDVEAKGVVKSQKFFPVFLNDNKEEIFKPLSNTKPLLTPFFAYSEVFWSNVINAYFDSSAPIYRLAICECYSEEVPKYNNHGTIVPSILNDGETLINLLEYFKENKDEAVDIDNYTNYCMKNYDYTSIFNSKIFSENKDLGEQLALQILISILKADQNYHYENVGFIIKDGRIISLAPPIDHEFSTIFLYLDCLEMNKAVFNNYKMNLLSKSTDEVFLFKEISQIRKNLDLIVDRYENVVMEFLKSLDVFIYDLEHNPVYLENEKYLYPFNTDNYKVGIAQYKNNDEETAKIILSTLKQHVVDEEIISCVINNEILSLAKILKKYLIEQLEIKHQKTLDFK